LQTSPKLNKTVTL